MAINKYTAPIKAIHQARDRCLRVIVAYFYGGNAAG